MPLDLLWPYHPGVYAGCSKLVSSIEREFLPPLCFQLSMPSWFIWRMSNSTGDRNLVLFGLFGNKGGLRKGRQSFDYFPLSVQWLTSGNILFFLTYSYRLSVQHLLVRFYFYLLHYIFTKFMCDSTAINNKSTLLLHMFLKFMYVTGPTVALLSWAEGRNSTICLFSTPEASSLLECFSVLCSYYSVTQMNFITLLLFLCT